MNDKTKRIIRKLIEVIPGTLHEYRFDIKNVGGAYEPHYGLVNPNFSNSPDIDIACHSHYRHNIYWDDPIDEIKLGVAIAEYVAYTCPANVEDLLDENERLKEALRDIAHGPVGYWNDLEHAQTVYRHFIKIAEQALRECEE